MLNPALLAVVTGHAAAEYRKASDTDMPWILSFVVAPMVLHRGTREALPASRRTYLATWLSRHPTLHAGLPQRARGLVEPVRRGIRFGLEHDIIRLDGDRLRSNLPKRPRGFHAPDELKEIVQKAGFVGRWFAGIDSAATVLAVLGVAP